jgi:hypothetical protein
MPSLPCGLNFSPEDAGSIVLGNYHIRPHIVKLEDHYMIHRLFIISNNIDIQYQKIIMQYIEASRHRYICNASIIFIDMLSLIAYDSQAEA